MTAATARLATEGVRTTEQSNTTYCYAVSDKVWATAPGAERWEVYTVVDDWRPDLEGVRDPALSVVGGDGSCCTEAGCC